MAYNGYLVKFGDYNFAGLIRADTYEVTSNARQDLDSYRDANGELHRTALEHTATSITFTVRARTEAEHKAMMDSIVANYTSYTERDATVTYYDTENCTYKTGHFYIDSNLTHHIYGTYNSTIFYGESEFSLVEY